MKRQVNRDALPTGQRFRKPLLYPLSYEGLPGPGYLAGQTGLTLGARGASSAFSGLGHTKNLIALMGQLKIV